VCQRQVSLDDENHGAKSCYSVLVVGHSTGFIFDMNDFPLVKNISFVFFQVIVISRGHK
jgi:hypothetical protein